MSRFFNSRLNHLAPYVPGEQPRNTARLIKLNTNENPYPPGTKVQEALAGAGCDQLRLYPDPDTTALVEAAAQVYGVKSSQVLPGNGSDELLQRMQIVTLPQCAQNGTMKERLEYALWGEAGDYVRNLIKSEW